MDRDDHDDHGGLARDLAVLSRRQIFGLFLIPLIPSCESSDGERVDASLSGSDAPPSGSCSQIPSETEGPYPGDGTNGPNALTLSGIVRSDIRASFAGPTGVAAGVPLTVTLTIVDAATCAPLAGHAVYIWHCDRDGNYSMYSAAVASENYLRGVQVTDGNGQVTFTTIFPGCYSGRWPHIHFEVYESVTAATNGANKLAVSQLAMPEATCNDVYATTGYESSASNLTHVSLATDMVFSDGATLELPTMTGAIEADLGAQLAVAIRT
jgi:protocatechuate 3,4-dioxygenase beta subunit